jgi:hypothetical protein
MFTQWQCGQVLMAVIGEGNRSQFAVEVQVHEGEVCAQPMMVLRDASVSHLVEAEDTL